MIDLGRFFNDKVVNKYRSNKVGLIVIAIIFVIVLFIIAFAYNNKQKKSDTVTYTLKDSISIEQDGELPNVEDYFEKISDIDKVTVDTSNVDVTTPGKYEVTIKIDGKEQIFVIEVLEKEVELPTVKLQDVEIYEGEEYFVDDFILSCEDADGNECNGITYYDDVFSNITNINELTDKELSLIEEETSKYALYTETGNYTVEITIIDDHGNVFNGYSANLIIKEKDTTNQTIEDVKNDTVATNDTNITSCSYGDLSYDTDRYPVISYFVGDTTNNCAVDRNLWDNSEYTSKAFDLREIDQKDLEQKINNYYTSNGLYANGSNIKYYANNKAVYNKAKTGLVGYAIEISVYIYDKDDEIDYTNDLKLKYYINEDGSRTYSVNEFNLN